MATFLWNEIVFGPIISRRVGRSLGVNLLPTEAKVCTFDCVYCECGGLKRGAKAHPLPTLEQVCSAIEGRFAAIAAEGQGVDSISFTGNGEPTLHPHFPDIVDDVRRLRDQLCPEARISVLSNSTQVHRPEVRQALMRTDNPIMKLDTVCPEYIRLVDRPQGHYDVEAIITHLAEMSPKVIIQTMFMGGEGVDDTADKYVGPWLEAVKRIAPRQVMIYTIDRETPVQGLLKATPERLNQIARQVRDAGLDCTVSY